MYKSGNLEAKKITVSAAIGKVVMVSSAVILFLMANLILPQNLEARTKRNPPLGFFLTLVNPAHLEYDALFLPEAPAALMLPAGGPSRVAEMVVSVSSPPSAIILPAGVRIASKKIRHRSSLRVLTSKRNFDNRVEVSPKMEKVILLKIENPASISRENGFVEITVLYE